MKALPHDASGQGNGFSPVWVTIWAARRSLELNVSLHPDSGQSKRFSSTVPLFGCWYAISLAKELVAPLYMEFGRRVADLLLEMGRCLEVLLCVFPFLETGRLLEVQADEGTALLLFSHWLSLFSP